MGPDEPVSTTSPERNRVRRQLAAAGIDLLAIASYVRVGVAGVDGPVIDELSRHLRLAADLGARFLRVFPGAEVKQGPTTRAPVLVERTAAVDARIVRRLSTIAPEADVLGVRPVLETHDSHPRGRDVIRVLEAMDAVMPGHQVGVIWDVLHPFRTGESPEHTAALLLPQLMAGRGYVQIKDVASLTELTPVPPGEGILPLPAIIAELNAAGYPGPVSLEWERAWYPAIPPLSTALAATRRWLDRYPPRPGT